MSDGIGITTHAGISGAGKTHGIRQSIWKHVAAGHQTVIVDRMREWDAVPPGLEGHVSGFYTEGSGVTPEYIDQQGTRLIVIRPQLTDVEATAEAACNWAMADRQAVRVVAIPEAHRAIPKKIDPRSASAHAAVQSIITEWRHYNVAMYCDSQRFAALNTDLVELSRTLRLFAMAGKNDFQALKDIGGSELVTAVKECAEKLDAGEPGWHVRLGTTRRPPYEITRDVL